MTARRAHHIVEALQGIPPGRLNAMPVTNATLVKVLIGIILPFWQVPLPIRNVFLPRKTATDL
jgi:hypothetical protein